MAARDFLTTAALARAVVVFIAVVVSSIAATTGSLAAQDPDADVVAVPRTVLDAAGEPVADRSKRPVLTNAADLARLVRRWYRALDLDGRLGGGSVLLLLRVEADGSVSDVRIARSGPHHPALNALARRAGASMEFDLAELAPAASERTGDLWVHQRIDFVR